MYCEFCELKPKLISIQKFTGQEPHTHDFDFDGKLFNICPICSSCDNATLRSDRELILKELKNSSKYSTRDKKNVLYLFANSLNLLGEERYLFVSNTMKEIKNVSDTTCITKLSEKFNIQGDKLKTIFYNIKMYRYVKHNINQR